MKKIKQFFYPNTSKLIIAFVIAGLFFTINSYFPYSILFGLGLTFISYPLIVTIIWIIGGYYNLLKETFDKE